MQADPGYQWSTNSSGARKEEKQKYWLGTNPSLFLEKKFRDKQTLESGSGTQAESGHQAKPRESNN
jgi:hypothetical protein